MQDLNLVLVEGLVDTAGCGYGRRSN